VNFTLTDSDIVPESYTALQWRLMTLFCGQTLDQQEHSTAKQLAESFHTLPEDVGRAVVPLMLTGVVEAVQREHRTRPLYYRITDEGRDVLRYHSLKTSLRAMEVGLSDREFYELHVIYAHTNEHRAIKRSPLTTLPHLYKRLLDSGYIESVTDANDTVFWRITDDGKQAIESEAAS
jgi:DNA-binding MarR family transcriptional regulator